MPACSDTGIQGKLTSGLGAVLFFAMGAAIISTIGSAGRHNKDGGFGRVDNAISDLSS
jgi:hypothetical protein